MEELFPKNMMYKVLITILVVGALGIWITLMIHKRDRELPKYDSSELVNELREWKKEQEDKVYER